MRNVLMLVVVGVMVLASAVAPCFAEDVASGFYGTKVSATQTNSTVTFPTTWTGINPDTGAVETIVASDDAVTGITVYNSSAMNEIFIASNATATTSSVEIPAGVSIALDNFKIKTLGVICSTGETATVYVYATLRKK